MDRKRLTFSAICIDFSGCLARRKYLSSELRVPRYVNKTYVSVNVNVNVNGSNRESDMYICKINDKKILSLAVASVAWVKHEKYECGK